MYMRVQYNMSKKASWKNHIDISKYTGMEVEHGLNTADSYAMGSAANLGHYDPTSHRQSSQPAFAENANKKLA